MRPLNRLARHCFAPDSVRTLIALHHGRKTKIESFASRRLEVNFFGGSEIAWIYVDCSGDSVSVAVPSKVKNFDGPARLPSFLPDEFVLRRQLTLLRKIPNSTYKWQLLYRQPMAEWIISKWQIIFLDTSYLTGNWPLTCKRILKRKRPCNTRTFSTKRKYGISKRSSPTPAKNEFVSLHVWWKRTEFQNTLRE